MFNELWLLNETFFNPNWDFIETMCVILSVFCVLKKQAAWIMQLDLSPLVFHSCA